MLQCSSAVSDIKPLSRGIRAQDIMFLGVSPPGKKNPSPNFFKPQGSPSPNFSWSSFEGQISPKIRAQNSGTGKKYFGIF